MRDALFRFMLDLGIPVELAFFIWAGLLFFVISLVGQAAVVFMVLMERKMLAWITQRKGPNRVGPFGLLQTVADGVKLLFKEDIMTTNQDKLLFTLAPVLFFAPTFVIYALIPFTDQLLGVNIVLGLLLVFALSSLSVVGIVLSGWASNNKYSLIGGMRSAAQAISYEIPLVLSALGIALASGTMNLKEIVEAQNAGQFGIFSWYWLSILPLSFVIFWISSIAEVNRIPFDLPEAESELVSGYNTEYSGMKFALFFLAEYASLFGMSALMAVLFFGGYYSPFGGLVLEKLGVKEPMLLQAEMATWLILKTYVFIALAMLIRGTLPRLKPDQLMGFSWKFLIPLSLVNIFLIAVLKLSWITPEATMITVGPFTVNAWYWITYAVVFFLAFMTLVAFGNIFKRKVVTRIQMQQRTVSP
jgi:NADH:ubiquinone oxidoreductase subunit H